MRRLLFSLPPIFCALFVLRMAEAGPIPASARVHASIPSGALRLSESEWARRLTDAYAGQKPVRWGVSIPGVRVSFPSHGRVIALTFDACGRTHYGRGYDADLIGFLKRERVPATLFLSGKWLDANPDLAKALADDPLFEIENHGLHHKPCSVSGRSAYGIKGTGSVGEVVDEVEGNARRIEAITHHRPRFYRAGTAAYDDVALKVVHALGYEAIGYNVQGDAGATRSAAGITDTLLRARPGSIVICHMNHPEGQTAEGIAKVVPLLRAKGFRFVRLDEGLPSRAMSNHPETQ